MNGPLGYRFRALIFAGVVSLAFLPACLAAQEGADFLFRRPVVTLTVRGGYAVPRASSDLFDFTRDNLWTLDRQEITFSAPAIQYELAVRVTDRIDVAAGVGHSKSNTRSEFQRFEGTDDLPIEQMTQFSRTPVTLSVKGYLLPRGRSLGRFAWVPARWAPFVGVGGGAVKYVWDQSGEFVDYQTFDIFRDRFRSEGTTASAHALAGLDLSLARYIVLSAEGRYSLASEKLGIGFDDFDNIDLSGFQATVGLSLRF